MLKHLLVILLTITLIGVSWAQPVFNNGGGSGDQLYSTVSNWNLNGSAGLPSSTEYAQLNGTPIFDVSTTVGSIRGVIATCGLANNGDNTITITAQDTPPFGDFSIWANNGGAFTIDVKVVLGDNGVNHVIKVDDGSSGSNGSIIFGENSELTINRLTDLETSATGMINFNGALKSSTANFRLDGGPNVTFGSTSNNAEFNRDFVFISGSGGTLTANTADNGTFIKAEQKIQVNGSNGKVVVNGENIYKGSISIAGSNTLRMEINKNQNSMQNVVLESGSLTLAIGSEVSLIQFSNSASSNWGTTGSLGTLTIENFKNGVLRFGTDATGLTAGQLSQINIGGGTAALDSEGYLIDSGSSTWTGSWSASPNPTDDAIINSAYTGNLEVSDLYVQTGASVIIASGETVKVNGTFINNGNVSIASGGSLVVMGAAKGNATITRNTAGNDGYSIIGAPVTGATLEGIVSQGANLIYESDGTDFTAVTSGAMVPGKGYFMAQVGEASPSVSFTGALVSGNVSATVAASGYTLVANPYASAISVDQLIASDAANATTGSVYIWSDGGTNGVSQSGKRDGSYLVSNQLTTQGVVGSVQGFFVQGQNGGDITFTPSMQVTSGNLDGSFYRKATDEKQILKLAISGNGLYHETTVGFLKRATFGRDYALDAEFLKGNDLISFYSKIEDVRFAIQGLPLVESDPIEVQLGMDLAEAGTYTISVEEFSGFSDLQRIILIDQLTGNSYELKNGFSVSFSTESVVDASRFKVVAAPANVLSIADVFDKVNVFGGTSELTINYTSDKVEQVNIYALDGRSVFAGEVAFKNNQALIDIDINRNQVHVLRVNNQAIKFIVK
ncbi:MAG: hypothetical protein RLO09_19430 [Cyclobacteriaceae bacterium]